MKNTIAIKVWPQYLDNYSDPDAGEYAFAYTIDIKNTGLESVQLLSRHWVIIDGNNEKREVMGDGVVGEQPHIEPDKTYRYSSGAILSTRAGTMEGSYTFKTAAGDLFDAPIPAFALIGPGALQ